MRGSRTGIGVLAAVVGLAVLTQAGPRPIIPKEQIPDDMPADVRRQVEKLYSGNDDDQIGAANALAHMGPDAASAAPFLASMLRDPVRHGSVGWRSADALIRIGDAAVEPTILAFQMGNRYARMRAHKVFAELKDPRSIPMLVSAITDSLGASGKNAWDTLHAIGPPAQNYLMDGVKDKNPDIRYAAVLAMPAFPTTNTIEVLSGALADDDIRVRIAARESLLRTLERNKALEPPLNDAMLKALDDKDPAARKLAVKVAVKTSGDRKVAAIAALVKDPDRDVQLTVIDTLGWIRHPAAVDALLSVLDTPDTWVRMAVVDALGRNRAAKAAPHLRKLMNDEDPTVRERVVTALAGLRTPEDVPVLIEALRDRDGLVRVRAATGLGDIRDLRAIAPLKVALSDIDKGVRLEAVVSLVLYYCGEARLRKRSPRRLPATKESPLHSKPVREALLVALDDEVHFVRQHAVDALLSVREPPDLEVALRALQDPDSGICRVALDYLSRIPGSTALEKVRPLAKSGDHRIRQAALRFLGQKRDHESYDLFVQAVKGDRHLAGAGVEALRGFGARAIEPLEGAMTHDDCGVRHKAAEALANMQNDKATTILVDGLQSKDERIRDAAAHALGRRQHGGQSAEVLLSLVREKIHDPRTADQLARLGSNAVAAASELLGDDDAATRAVGARILGQTRSTPAVDPLLKALEDPDRGVREAAIRALGALQDKRAVVPLCGVLWDKHASVREAAAAILGDLGDPAAVEPLAGVLDSEDWHIRWIAAQSLGKLGKKEALPALHKGLTDPHWYVRGTAARALGGIRDSQSIPLLAETAKDDHWHVRHHAHAALAKLKAAKP